MKFKTVVILLVATVLSCQPPKEKTVTPDSLRPYDVTGLIRSGGLDVSWKANINRTISGYNIFISQTSLSQKYPDGVYGKEVRPFNHPVFPGDTNPSDAIEHYTALGLDNGTRYYVTVRTVLPDQTMSAPSDEIMVVPGPSGVIELMSRFSGDHDGYSFVSDQFVRADEVTNDLLFYAVNDVPYLASPTRLDGFLNQTLLQKLAHTGDFTKVRRQLNRDPVEPGLDRVEISAGDWVLARLASSQHVLFRVEALTPKGEHPSVRLRYTVCTLEREILF